MKRIILVILITAMICIPVCADETNINAKSCILIDGQSGETLFEQNMHEKLPIASITKVMTLLLTFEAIEKGELSLDEILITSEYASSMCGSDVWLKQGEQMSVNDLIKATVIMSANDAAVVLAEKIAGSADSFIKMMNERAKDLSMQNTVFKNINGLDEEGHYSSAFDVALMAKELIKHEKIFDYTLTWMDYIRSGETQLVNTNKLIRTYDGITGLKTGITSQAGSCICATAKRDGVSLIAVSLGSPSTDERFKSAETLLDFGFSNFEACNPEMSKKDTLPILYGMKKKAALIFPEEEGVLVKKGESVACETILPENATAPIKKGETAGKVVYKKGESILFEKDIEFGESIEAISFSKVFTYLISLLKRI